MTNQGQKLINLKIQEDIQVLVNSTNCSYEACRKVYLAIGDIEKSKTVLEAYKNGIDTPLDVIINVAQSMTHETDTLKRGMQFLDNLSRDNVKIEELPVFVRKAFVERKPCKSKTLNFKPLT